MNNRFFNFLSKFYVVQFFKNRIVLMSLSVITAPFIDLVFVFFAVFFIFLLFFNLWNSISIFFIPELFLLIVFLIGFFFYLFLFFKTYAFKQTGTLATDFFPCGKVSVTSGRLPKNLSFFFKSKSVLSVFSDFLVLSFFFLTILCVYNIYLFVLSTHIWYSAGITYSIEFFYLHHSLRVDFAVLIWKFFASFLATVIFLFSKRMLSGFRIEVYFVFLILMFAFFIVVSSNNLIVFFVSLEVFSISLLGVAASTARVTERSISALLKYYIIGTLSSMLLILAVVLLFALSGTVAFEHLSLYSVMVVSSASSFNQSMLLCLSVLYFLVSIMLKVGLFPVHFWIIDIYENISTFAMLVFLSIGKLAYFFVLFVFVNYLFFGILNVSILAPISVFSYLCLSISGLAQTTFKRFLIFSSFANSSVILFIFSLQTKHSATLFFSYLFYDLILFVLAVCFVASFISTKISVSKNGMNFVSANSLNSIYSLGQIRSSFAKCILCIYFLMLSGLPPFFMFLFKFSLLYLAIPAKQPIFLLILFMCSSVINAYNYIRLIKVCLFLDKSFFNVWNESKLYKNVFYDLSANIVLVYIICFFFLFSVFSFWNVDFYFFWANLYLWAPYWKVVF